MPSLSRRKLTVPLPPAEGPRPPVSATDWRTAGRGDTPSRESPVESDSLLVCSVSAAVTKDAPRQLEDSRGRCVWGPRAPRPSPLPGTTGVRASAGAEGRQSGRWAGASRAGVPGPPGCWAWKGRPPPRAWPFPPPPAPPELHPGLVLSHRLWPREALGER